jgi:hypothetical protein
MEWEWLLPPPFDLLFHPILRRVRKRKRERLLRDAATWPRTPGRVEQAVTIKEFVEGDLAWHVRLTYSYVVNGQYYSGVFLLPSELEPDAIEHASAWKGREVVVRYWPENVSDSVILLEDQAPLAPPASPAP